MDDSVLERRDSHASSSHELSSEPTSARSVDLGKHSVYTHFPKDRNCEICQRTKITRAPVQKTQWRSRTSCRKFLVIWLQEITMFSVKVVSLETIIDMQSWCRTWHPDGSRRIRAKQKLLRKHKGACRSSWIQIGSLKSFTLTIPWNLAKPVKIFPGIIVRRHHTDRNCWKSSAQSKKRYLCCIVAIRSGWKLVGRFHGMLHLSAKRHRSIIWWEDALWKTFWATSYRTDHSIWFIGWVLPYICERPVKNPSIWKESLTWFVPSIRFAREGNLEGWHIGCRHWGVGNDGRIRNLLQKTQCKRSTISQRKWKFHFSSRRWTSHTFWKRSGTENIHHERERPIRGEITKIFLENQKTLFHHLMTHFRMPVKRWMVFGPCQETSYAATTLSPESHFTRRETSHSLFHWSTLTFPELHIRIWMSSKRNASMITGISMGHDTCRILGQVSHNLFYWKKNLLKDICGPERD